MEPKTISSGVVGSFNIFAKNGENITIKEIVNISFTSSIKTFSFLFILHI
jgi:hypothetical protein